MDFRRITHSIVTRLIIFGIVVALVTGIARYFLLSDFLREDLEKVVSSQQEALADYVARDIDYKIVERKRALIQLAKMLPIGLLDQPQQLQNWLQERHEFQPLFSQGFFVTDAQGVAIADYPVLPQRTGTDYFDRDYVVAAFAGEVTVGRPVMGRAANEPVVPIAAPVFDGAGKVRAVLAGITATAAPGFFDLLQQIYIGETGGFLLISPRDQIFVAATNPQLILKPTAHSGVNSLHDRALAGWRGSGITINAQGVEEIAAIASVPSTGWFVVARLPTEEAFATVKRTQNYIIRNAFIIILFFMVIMGIGLTIIFRPLARAANHAELMTQGALPLSPLPIERDDEVGHLVGAFNRLLDKLLTSQSELARVASHDLLTGLPNRRLLSDRMAQSLARSQRNKTPLAVLFLDLDGFKPINDRLGHQAGDDALAQVAQRLSAIVREDDTLARVGGDEFVVVISDLSPKTEVAEAAVCAVAEKCIEAVHAPMPIMGESLLLGISIGIAMGNGESSFDDLLSAADTAMYKAKDAGRGRYVLADASRLNEV